MTEGLYKICNAIRSRIAVTGDCDLESIQALLPSLRLHHQTDVQICNLLGLTFEQLNFIERPVVN